MIYRTQVKSKQPSTPIWVQNAGPEITHTNYWDSPMADAGKFYISVNGGCLRILLPDQMRGQVSEMRGAKYVILTRGPFQGRDGLEILFEDDSPSPYVLYTVNDAMDRVIPTSEAGREVVVSVHTRGGKALTLPGHFRVASKLPCLKALEVANG